MNKTTVTQNNVNIQLREGETLLWKKIESGHALDHIDPKLIPDERKTITILFMIFLPIALLLSFIMPIQISLSLFALISLFLCIFLFAHGEDIKEENLELSRIVGGYALTNQRVIALDHLMRYRSCRTVPTTLLETYPELDDIHIRSQIINLLDE